MYKFLALGRTVILALGVALSASNFASAKDARVSEFERAIISVQDFGKPDAKTWPIADRMAAYGVAGVGVAIIDKGKIVWAHGYGVLSANGAERGR